MRLLAIALALTLLAPASALAKGNHKGSKAKAGKVQVIKGHGSGGSSKSFQPNDSRTVTGTDRSNHPAGG